MQPIDAALAAIDALKPGEKLVYAKIARKFGVDPVTLSRRHRGISTSRQAAAENRQALHPEHEAELIEYIDRLSKRGLPPTRNTIRNIASQLAQRQVGYHWVDRFVHRYPHLVLLKRTTPIDRSRRQADSEKKYQLYFELLRQKIDQYEVEPRHIYNMDEKGFMIGVQSRSVRIFSQASLRAGLKRSNIQDGNREWITVIACICADGSYLDPSIIYSSQASSIQNSWLQGFDPDIHTARIAASPTGWSNDNIGIQWLKQVFDPATKPKARSSYRLLLMDGHHSHITIDFINYCDQNKILLAIFPPHSTHTLQPLDVGLFKPLSTAYSNELSSFMDTSQGLLPITKSHFFPLFWRAWRAAFKESSILQAFEATGISPFNPEVILQKFKTTATDSNRKALVASASDWRTIRRLINEATSQAQSHRSISALSRILMKQSADTAFLERENKQLRAALIDERQRKQRSQPGTLELSNDYYGGATFWSPQKVHEARRLYEQKQRDQEELQRQKSIAIKAREERKLLKAQELEARRRARAEAKLEREKRKAEEAARRTARQAARKQPQKAIKIRQIGKKVSFKHRVKPKSKNIIASGGGSGAELGNSSAARLPPRSRCGRPIKLPTKYR